MSATSVTQESGKGSNKVAFFVTAPPADEPRYETMLGYALAAAAMGFEVLIFFTLDAALTVKKQVFSKMNQKIRERVQEAMKMGVKFAACSSAIQTYGIKQEEIIDGVEVWGIASFYDYAANAKMVISW
ncbi:DsrE family protein [Vulcanisaeta thermophila]|uniref:DsrE family protein n=1 Tax=Vulcanisaeta thermophila TaxID=867917 RepID=UPI000852FD9A|nr:DsrE family protein [Vulcanisaeta thermophila]